VIGLRLVRVQFGLRGIQPSSRDLRLFLRGLRLLLHRCHIQEGRAAALAQLILLTQAGCARGVPAPLVHTR
jgi:hypothetical protein